MASQNLTDRALGSMAWMGSGTGAQALLRAVVVIVLARLLTPEDFGVVAAALVVVSFSNIVAQLGFGQAMVQRETLSPAYVRTGFTLSVLTGVVFAAGVALLAPALGALFAMPDLTPVLRLLSTSFLLTGPAITAQALLRRDLAFRALAMIEAGSFLFGFALVGIVLAAVGMGVWALALAHLATVVLRGAALLMINPHPVRPLLDPSSVRELVRMGGGFTIGRFFNFLALQGDYFVVGRWMGGAALGAYGRAYELMVTPATLFGKVVDVVLFPVLAKVQTEPRRLALGFLRGLAFVALLTMPLGAVMTLLAPELVAFLLGAAWAEAVPALQVLTVGIFFRTSYKISESVLRATGAVYARAWRQAVYAVLVVVGAWLGHHWGLGGVAMGVLFAITVNFALMTECAARHAHVDARRIWMVHVPALTLTLAVGISTAVLAAWLRTMAAPAPVVLGVSLVAAAVFTAALARFADKAVLGAEGIWVVQRLAGMFRVARFLPKRWTRAVAEHS